VYFCFIIVCRRLKRIMLRCLHTRWHGVSLVEASVSRWHYDGWSQACVSLRNDFRSGEPFLQGLWPHRRQKYFTFSEYVSLSPQTVAYTQRQNVQRWVYKLNPLTPTVAIMGTAMKHPVPDRVEPSFVIFDIRAIWRFDARPERYSAWCLKLQKTT